ncbi:VIT1/CCC1 transporter family protein [Stappia sp.]|jgi:VIT1/CCC1 family predicted Fe2+/Mn2+ transporter|uniref:VIT1/CCC1 transporter family protein n=1 Tax=Stappia sp. TaxID=1870903 RepID=UPI003A98EAB1
MAISKGRAMAHVEEHSVQRIGWLRAAVLGANDGLVSTASLITGVAASQAPTSQILIAGAAGLIAGAMSMAAGEYVSVSSQSDTEKADLERESRELAEQPEFELEELAETFAARGVSRETALAVARELTAADALAAHAREELGITEVSTARPLQAAVTSAITFAVGAALPLAVVVLAPASALLPVVAVSTLVFLALLGALGARAGGAPPLKGAVRVTIWGAAALAITAAAGALFGASV